MVVRLHMQDKKKKNHNWSTHSFQLGSLSFHMSITFILIKGRHKFLTLTFQIDPYYGYRTTSSMQLL